MGQFHLEVAAEYVRRLLRDVKLKDTTKQQEAYVSVTRDAERLHESFCKMVRLHLDTLYLLKVTNHISLIISSLSYYFLCDL